MADTPPAALDLLEKWTYNEAIKTKGCEPLKAQSKNLDMTTGPIWYNMVAFAVPVFLGQLFQQLYNTADSVIVGNFVGKDALAAVSSSDNLIFMMTGFFMGLSLGAGVVISRYFGARDEAAMHRTVHTSIAFGAVCGLVMTVAGVYLTPQILVLMNTPQDVLPLSITYFRLYFTGAFFSLMYNTCMGILRAVGDSRTPLYYLIFSSLINVVFDLLFVGPLGMGVAGAAIATVISQAVSAVLCFVKLLRSTGPERVEPGKIRFDLPMLRQIAGLGIPSGVQNSIISIANVVVQSNINVFGSDAMAGCGSYAKVEGFVFLPITAFTSAITTFIGQNLGAREYRRAKQGAAFGIFWACALAEGLGVLLYFICPTVIRFFGDDPEVVRIGVAQMRTECFFFFALAYAHGVSAVMRGAGRAKMPMFTMLACWCVLRVAYITLAVKAFPVVNTIFWAYPLTWCVSCVVFFLYYKKADWVHSFDHRLPEIENS